MQGKGNHNNHRTVVVVVVAMADRKKAMSAHRMCTEINSSSSNGNR